MRYLPHTPDDIQTMLTVVGADDLEALFADVPKDCRMKEGLDLPPALTEWELNAHLAALAEGLPEPGEYISFLGAGSYEHHIPEVIQALRGRGEFLTPYTPYQPELSQGTLTAIYEYQTLTARLLGLEAANASLYDGASALAEALLMAVRVTRKTTVALSRLIHPHYRQVAETYLRPTGCRLVELNYLEDGRTDLNKLPPEGELAVVALQSPNFFGVIEDLKNGAEEAHDRRALLVAAFTEPLAYGLLKSPGSLGADIACGEGQSFGLAPSFGGPGLGMFACLMDHVRSMPGRLVGQTLDREGRRGFVLTLATREQHIRRERATSNICTNASHSALTAAMYMAALGRTGLAALARLNHDKAMYLRGALEAAGLPPRFRGPVFNEFVVQAGPGFERKYQALLTKKILFGLPLRTWYPELEDGCLLCVTETRSRAEMDALVQEVRP